MIFCTKCGAKHDDGAMFCSKCGTPLQSPAQENNQKTIPNADQNAKRIPNSAKQADDIPFFTPPADNDDIPFFEPPAKPNNNEPVCFHHPNEPAAAQCARCGKYICKDCAEAYTVSSGDYENKCLCFDCCQALVAENVELLKKQKTQIIKIGVITLIGMIAGLVVFCGAGAPALAVFIGMLWFGSFGMWVKNSFLGWWNNPAGRSLPGFIGACLGGAVVAPFKTIIKIVQCVKYWISTSKYIEEDSEALEQMREYMEYTQVRSENKGVDLETLMAQGSELYNNSYAKMVSTQGEAAADAKLRKCTTTIAKNGEIIRNFAA